MNKPFVSIVIPTYNRKFQVINAIDSALNFLKFDVVFEIIIADDASNDHTIDFLNDRYEKELSKGLIKIFSSPVNVGASGAKNLGAFYSKGYWIIFLDSDDLLIEEQLNNILCELKECESFPIIFFRSVDLDTGELIGLPKKRRYQLNTRQFLETGTPGECLPVVSNIAFKEHNYLSSLRGCEGFAYSKIINSYGDALVSTLVVRRYDMSDVGRLSVGDGFNSRSCEIARYHFLLFIQFFSYLSNKKKLKSILAVFYYIFKCSFWKISKSFKLRKVL